MENNVVSAFLDKAAEFEGEVCALHKSGGKWKSVSWEEMVRRSLSMAASLRKLGLKKGDRVAMMVTTRIEWTIADMAIMAAGGVNVPIYCSFTAERIRTILEDATPLFAIVEDASIAKLLTDSNDLNGSKLDLCVIGVEEHSAPLLVGDLAEKATPQEIKDIERSARLLTADDVASYVYTSGTTGELKAVVVTHGMILSEIRGAEEAFGLDIDDVQLVCLPLAHVLGRLSQLYPLLHGTRSAYAESFAKLAENYREVRPHYVCGVPRMLEKIYERVQAHLEKASVRKRRLANWALRIGRERSQLLQKHRPIPFELNMKYRVADFLVFRMLRARLGGRLRLFICGGAKLPEEVTRFFHAVGITVLEGYGLTETFAAVTANRPDDYHFGTVGKPLPGVSVRIAPDGEILIKGDNLFREYLHRPEETKAAFDYEGWFRTGDLGEYSRDGFLRITGRKKDMIVTAGGKNIAPQRIETIMSSSPLISHFVVQGDGRKYLTALITLDEDQATRYLKEKGIDSGDGRSIGSNPVIREYIEGHVREKNEELSSFETIKRFAILDGEFSVSGGELTPTLKVRRDFTRRKYRDVLEGLYRD